MTKESQPGFPDDISKDPYKPPKEIGIAFKNPYHFSNMNIKLKDFSSNT